jgi:small subunit ribosomal protein S20
MNKKQRNRKIVTQNKRNKIINRRYSSTIKTLLKLFSTKIKQSNLITHQENTEVEQSNILNKRKVELFLLVRNIYSIIDKAIKKQVIHKNTGARKKSKIAKIFQKF